MPASPPAENSERVVDSCTGLRGKPSMHLGRKMRVHLRRRAHRDLEDFVLGLGPVGSDSFLLGCSCFNIWAVRFLSFGALTLNFNRFKVCVGIWVCG